MSKVKFDDRSPVDQIKVLLKIWAMVCFLLLGSCAVGFHLDSPYTESTSHDATLVQAYSSMQKCGKHDSCEEFKGRFKLKEDGRIIDREIDGFFYHNYVDGGRKDMAAYVTLSPNQMGVQSPGWIVALMLMGIPGFLIFFVCGFGFLFSDTDYEQRKWVQEQERKARDAKWRNM